MIVVHSFFFFFLLPHQVKSLATLREEFGETEKRISYLKLDVEGFEIEAMERWADEEGSSHHEYAQPMLFGVAVGTHTHTHTLGGGLAAIRVFTSLLVGHICINIVGLVC